MQLWSIVYAPEDGGMALCPYLSVCVCVILTLNIQLYIPQRYLLLIHSNYRYKNEIKL